MKLTKNIKLVKKKQLIHQSVSVARPATPWYVVTFARNSQPRYVAQLINDTQPPLMDVTRAIVDL